MPPVLRNGAAEYTRLERRLVLLAWLIDLFGYHDNRELLSDLKEAAEGYDPHGRSFICHHLLARGDRLKLSEDDLLRYDENIRRHLGALNERRPEPITLRYFQYLALLFTEVFLDRYFNHRPALLAELNAFVKARNAAKLPGEPPDPAFVESDLTKLAYWMATGSGKTIIMHMNYRQFLHYNREPLDNILLITPNEGLSEQHMEEMAASGIPCRRFDPGESGLGFSERNVVRVIEITKLVEEKRGGGQSVPVEAFEGNNLIFVDEGHKGSGGEAWRRYRDALSGTGFTFEYSATFGQALTAARNDALTAEYGKAIVFDYSYRYFHGDGFGKDFYILNLKEETTEERTEMLLLGNLLSFYEQLLVFAEESVALRPYNLEKPLWVFVGSSVNAVYTEERRKRSDVLTVARFLHHVLENKGGWAVEAIGRILEGRTGLFTPDGEDLFAGRFAYLRGRMGADPAAIYRGILAKVFHAQSGGALHLCEMRGHPGELGLKAPGAEDYFGLIYIGDTAAFKKLLEADEAGIILEEDAITGSLFAGINAPDSPINILIGAKKFMEGWNSWRVSNMGLLNIGRQEGSEIIQLFGRGVRLKGKGLSLKRSAALPGEHPRPLRLLETLNIFAVRANYMAQFREYLEREGVETEGEVEIPLAIRPNREFLGKGLLVPRLPEVRSFAEKAIILLRPDPSVRVRVDLSPRVVAMASSREGLAVAAVRAGEERRLPEEVLRLVDWDRIYLDLVAYKERKGLANLIIRPEAPREILSTEEPAPLYGLIAEESVFAPRSFADAARIQEAVLAVLCKYLDAFYRHEQERWESREMEYRLLNEKDPNFQDYKVRIARGERDLIAAVARLVEEGKRIYEGETRELPNIHFDRHLYQPLLLEGGGKFKTEPPGLRESERRFVEDLRAYCRAERDGALAGKEIFLLRNLSRGKGIGFFEKRGFYPDFIL
ncbi:MAG: DEAD/DEAH box helicase family protein, partial [Firmicutes bacterium]|nr:DEAD/DEAH box helicase family protein [Bacillota bacterium]